MSNLGFRNRPSCSASPRCWRSLSSLSNAALTVAAAAALASPQAASAQADPLSFRTLTSTGGFGHSANTVNANSYGFNIASLGDYQVAAWYRPLTDPNAPGAISIARRNLRTGAFDITNLDSFVANNITDNHDVISLGISGEGLVHISWGMHSDPTTHYSRSDRSIADGPLSFNTIGDARTPRGETDDVTYPEFVRLNGGNLLFQYRIGGSGNGDTHLNRWNVGPQGWNTRLQQPLIDGFVRNEDTRSVNAYTNGLTVDSRNRLHQTWTFRENAGGAQANSHIYYAYSDDAGLTWNNADGVAYDGPITQANASLVVNIPQNSNHINQTGMAVDSNNRPLVLGRWSENGGPATYRLAYQVEAGQPWEVSDVAVSNGGSRPAVAVLDDWGTDRVLAIFQSRDSNRQVTIGHSLDRVNWEFIQIDDSSLGGWQGRYDTALFNEQGILSFLHIETNTDTRNPSSQDSRPVSFLDWDARGYFSLLLHDLNNDARVDEADLSLLDANLGATGLAGADHFFADVTRDGVVDLADREQLLLNFTDGVPVPEPTSLALLGLGGFALMRRRRPA